MKWTIEVVTVPVSDVERAKRFYADRLGFVVDIDTEIGDGSRMVQLTPPTEPADCQWVGRHCRAWLHSNARSG